MFERSVERSEVELIGPNPHQKRRISLESGGPVQLAVTFTDLRLVYEAKVPFSEINALSGAKPDFAKNLGLGLETGKFDFGAMRGRMPGRRGGRGISGGLGGGMSGGGPFAGGDRRKGGKAGMAPGSWLSPVRVALEGSAPRPFNQDSDAAAAARSCRSNNPHRSAIFQNDGGGIVTRRPRDFAARMGAGAAKIEIGDGCAVMGPAL